MTEKDLEIIELAKEVETKGLDFVCKKYKYSKRKVLNILYAASNMRMINKKQRKTFLKLLEQQLFKWKLNDDKIGILADTHIGNELENLEYIKRAYEEFYKNKITNVFHLGDLLDGYGGGVQESLSKEEKQYICKNELDYLKKEYPQGFTNFLALGNHEEQFKGLGMDLERILPTIRKDFIPLGTGYGYLNWEEDKIALGHKTRLNKNPIYINDCDYYFYGHSHFYNYEKGTKVLKVPTCSDVQPNQITDRKYKAGFVIVKRRGEELVAHRYIFEDNKPQHAFRRVLK